MSATAWNWKAEQLMKTGFLLRCIIFYLLAAAAISCLSVFILPYHFWVGLILILLVGVIIGYLSCRLALQPICQIGKRVQQATRGELIQTPLSTTNEIDLVEKSLAELLLHQQAQIAEGTQEKNKLTAILTGMAEGVIACNTNTHIMLTNRAVEELFQIQAKDIQGKMFLEAIRNNDLAEILSQVLQTGKPWCQEISILLPVQKNFMIQASPLFQESRVSGAVMVLHDITELKHLENVRKEFISNVSHELKTPLTSIKGFIETLLAGAMEDKNNNRRFLSIIQDHADRLGKLINDILELSKLESKEIQLDFKPIDLPEIIRKTVETFTPQLTKNKVTCSVNIKGPLPKVQADHDKISQVLINLIDNAIKFNKEKGAITITAELQPAFLKVSIHDTGIGLPDTDLPRIFERFYRVDKARSRDLGGTGLGLSIVKHIIEAHHGQVGVESIQEQGSTFWFTLPLV